VKILIVKMSSMGDVVHALPALTDALAFRSDLVVDWCVESTFAPIVRLHPGVRKVHEIRLRTWKKKLFRRSNWQEARALIRALRSERYDLVIDAQGLLKSAIVARLAGAPVAGMDASSAREGTAARLYGRRIAVSRELHAIDRLRLLFGHILNYQPDLAHIDYGLLPPETPPGTTPTAILLHGTTWASKRWSTANWIELARSLTERGYRPELTFSDAEEEKVARAIAEGAPGARIVPKMQLNEVAAWIGAASLVVGCDSGLTHLAAAFGRPTLALFLSTRPELTGVVGQRATVIEADIACAPCRSRTCPKVPAGETQPCVGTVPAALVLKRAMLLVAAS